MDFPAHDDRARCCCYCEQFADAFKAMGATESKTKMKMSEWKALKEFDKDGWVPSRAVAAHAPCAHKMSGVPGLCVYAAGLVFSRGRS